MAARAPPGGLIEIGIQGSGQLPAGLRDPCCLRALAEHISCNPAVGEVDILERVRRIAAVA
jgi:hypothetical protein